MEAYLPESGRSSIVADGLRPEAVRASSNFRRAHSSTRLMRGEWSERITRPGMMNTQPGITGRINPTMPIRISPTPTAIRPTFLKPVPILENLYLALFATQTYKIDVLPAKPDSTMKLDENHTTTHKDL
jgi:hypothetical protein